MILAEQEAKIAKQARDTADMTYKGLAAKADEAKAALLACMKENGLLQSQLDYGMSTIVLSVRKGSLSVDVPDLEAVPQDFIRVKREPDKKKIADMLKDGALVNWATLQQGEDILMIDSKANRA